MNYYVTMILILIGSSDERNFAIAIYLILIR